MEALFGPLWLPCLILFLIGVVLLIVELCLPGFGLSGCVGALSCLTVIVMQYTTNSPAVATGVSFVMAIIIALLVALFVRSISGGALFRSPIVLKEKIGANASTTADDRYADLLGKTGTVETTLRPAGTALIDGTRYPVKSRADFIEKGSSVTVVAVRGLDIIVE